jgi:type II secretory pathway component PulF
MVKVGEKTGNLEESLLYLADFYEKEVDNTTQKLSTILEPVLLIIIGLIVGFIAVSIITPIYQITRGLRG